VYEDVFKVVSFKVNETTNFWTTMQVGRRGGEESERRRVGPEYKATFSLFIAAFSQECMGQLASFGPT
jgi:hypothetical protein